MIDLLTPRAAERIVTDVRVGLGYTSARLDDGHVGLAWTGRSHTGHCTHMDVAGTLAGRPAAELLAWLTRLDGPLFRTVGLATANALAAGLPPLETTPVNVLDLIDVQETDRVAMVGFFGPLMPRLRATGCSLTIVDLEDGKPGTASPEEGRAALADCSVAIITGTAVVTGTIDEVLAQLGSPRAAVLLGPSSFMRPEVFAGTGVTHLAGGMVRDGAAVERVVSEGGGTRCLKPYVDFLTVACDGRD